MTVSSAIILLIIAVLIGLFLSKSHSLADAKDKIHEKESELSSLKERFDNLGGTTIEETRAVLQNLNYTIDQKKHSMEIEEKQHDNLIEWKNKAIEDLENKIKELNSEAEKGEGKVADLEKKIENQKARFQKNRDLYTAMTAAIERYYHANIDETGFRPLSADQMKDMDSLAPSVLLNLKSMNYQDLRKKFLNNQKQIEEVYKGFIDRYTTKTTQALYQVMIIALSSELQNILTKLKYGKLDEGIEDVHTVVNKFISIAEAGNQTIAGTVKQFAYTIEKLFEDAVNIEYEYYIKKEQAHQEQLALKARMREEREEQRRLAEQAAQMKREEEKYLQEKERLETKLQETQTAEDKAAIESDLEKLNEQLNSINEKKEEITKLQHGKAGNVYIISNLGSFGDNVFKIGMTRRLDPQERIDELGSASVPFGFDVHSFIFSDDASGLETELHRRLNERRVNKVNKRKEFFSVSLDELEELVNEIYPSAEFNRTMLAEEYRQSLSLSENAFDFDDDNEKEPEEETESED